MTVLAVIGTGRWGSNWVRTLASMSGVELRWCCDLSEAALGRIGKQYPDVQVTTRLEELLHDEAVAGVVIATSAPTHFRIARQALQAGKHVLVEKPMTLNSTGALELTRLARCHRRILMVGHLLEYHPAIGHLRQIIDQGELGDISYLHCQRLDLGVVRSDENVWWSLAPHDIALACRLMNEMPKSVQCRGQDIVQPDVADVVLATLEFSGRRLAHIHVSWLHPQKTRKLTVVGSRKMAVFDDTLPAYKVTVYDKGFRNKPPDEAGSSAITIRQGDIAMPRHDTDEPLLLEAQHFVDCIRTGRQPISDGESGTRVVSVIEHGQQSLEHEGAVVPIPRPVTKRREAIPAYTYS